MNTNTPILFSDIERQRARDARREEIRSSIRERLAAMDAADYVRLCSRRADPATEEMQRRSMLAALKLEAATFPGERAKAARAAQKEFERGWALLADWSGPELEVFVEERRAFVNHETEERRWA
jgi:hypothetical protein